jgi:hypothetical protein
VLKLTHVHRANPFLTYYIFSAAIMHVYNASFDPALEKPAKKNLARCMSALEAMEVSPSSPGFTNEPGLLLTRRRCAGDLA